VTADKPNLIRCVSIEYGARDSPHGRVWGIVKTVTYVNVTDGRPVSVEQKLLAGTLRSNDNE